MLHLSAGAVSAGFVRIGRVDPPAGICDSREAVTALDPEVARSLAADLPRDVFVSIVKTFEQDLARLVREMVEGARAGDTDAYRRAAHGLAGAAGSIGALRLEALAREAMRSDDVVPPLQRLREVGAEARAALTELAALSA